MSAIQAVVIGGSAGALDALSTILSALPRHFALPIALVVHIPPDLPSLLPQVLSAYTELAVKEAEDKEPLKPGTLYIATPNYHLLMEKHRSLSLSVDDKVQFSRPAIDVLFESAAEALGPALAAVLLTGANEDGALGLARIKAAGGTTLVQSPESATVPTMPEAARWLDARHRVIPLREIASALGEIAAVPSERPNAAPRRLT